MSTMFKRVLAGTVLAAAALLPAASAASAAPAGPGQNPAAVPCSKGYVCISVDKGVIIWVPEGQPYRFPEGTTMTAISNQTETGYCVGGSPNFGLGPGVEIVRDQPVFSFAPGRICLT